MKTAGYRKLAAILVIATTGLAGAACSKDKSGDTATGSGSSSVLLDKNTKVTISVDCEPPTTKAAQRKEWLDDIAAFNKIYPNVTINSKDASPCEEPAAYAALSFHAAAAACGQARRQAMHRLRRSGGAWSVRANRPRVQSQAMTELT